MTLGLWVPLHSPSLHLSMESIDEDKPANPNPVSVTELRELIMSPTAFRSCTRATGLCAASIHQIG